MQYKPFNKPEVLSSPFECEECDVSIVIPTYYKERSFPHVVDSISEQLTNVLTENGPLKAEIIIVVNWDEWEEDAPAVKIAQELLEQYRESAIKFDYPKNSDSTWQTSKLWADALASVIPLKVVRYSSRLGKMAAMQKWAEIAKWNVVAFVDADLTFPNYKPFLLAELVNPVYNGKVQITIASLWANMGNAGMFAKRLSGQRALNRQQFLGITQWLQENWIWWYWIETALTLVIEKLFGKRKIKIVDWEGVWQLTKVYKDPLAAPIGYIKMWANVLKTLVKVRRLLKDPQKLKELQTKIMNDDYCWNRSSEVNNL